MSCLDDGLCSLSHSVQRVLTIWQRLGVESLSCDAINQWICVNLAGGLGSLRALVIICIISPAKKMCAGGNKFLGLLRGVHLPLPHRHVWFCPQNSLLGLAPRSGGSPSSFKASRWWCFFSITTGFASVYVWMQPCGILLYLILHQRQNGVCSTSRLHLLICNQRTNVKVRRWALCDCVSMLIWQSLQLIKWF